MKPMLATAAELDQLRYPLYASPKLDGVRGLVIDGVLHSRSLKPIGNKFTQARFSKPEYSGLDGEFILGDPCAKDVYRQTNSVLARQTGTPDVDFYVFDDFEIEGIFSHRHDCMQKSLENGYVGVKLLEQIRIDDEQQLLNYEQLMLDKGYEGLMLRDPAGLYKYGRSTVKEGALLKLKRFTDSEAEILEVIEEMENTNAATKNELGRTKRSSAAVGLVGKGRAGALRVKDLVSGVEFGIGTGLNDEDRTYYWKHRRKVVGKLIKYKSFLVGVKDLPRFPTYLGGREAWDL